MYLQQSTSLPSGSSTSPLLRSRLTEQWIASLTLSTDSAFLTPSLQILALTSRHNFFGISVITPASRSNMLRQLTLEQMDKQSASMAKYSTLPPRKVASGFKKYLMQSGGYEPSLAKQLDNLLSFSPMGQRPYYRQTSCGDLKEWKLIKKEKQMKLDNSSQIQSKRPESTL